MTTPDQVRKNQKQRQGTYGLIPPAPIPPAMVMFATGAAGPMVGGNITVFPLGATGNVPTDAVYVVQRTVPGAGALGDENVDTITPGVGGSFRIHSSAATEVSSWQWFAYSALLGG